MSDLSDITILITSFLREGYLRECLYGIAANLPECKVITVDDSAHFDSTVGQPPIYYSSSDGRETVIRLDFDSGLSAKRNAGVQACKTKYLLLGCDDFDFSPKDVREGIEKMVASLDWFTDSNGHGQFELIGGRVNNQRYEGYIDFFPADPTIQFGGYIREIRIPEAPPPPKWCLKRVDLTVNYFLAQTATLKQFPWPDEMKIGGEHICLFLDLKLAGKNVGYLSGVNINTQPFDPAKQDPRYAEYRARAAKLGHPLMMKRYNIRNYYGFP